MTDPFLDVPRYEHSLVLQEIRNMILTSCLIGKISNVMVANSLLEKLSGHSKETYYMVRNDLSSRGIVVVRGEGRSKYVELTEKGVMAALKHLTGKVGEDVSWEDVSRKMREVLRIFRWPIMCMRRDEKRKLMQALLLLYGRAPGNEPGEYYVNVLKRFIKDYQGCLSSSSSGDLDFAEKIKERLEGLNKNVRKGYEGFVEVLAKRGGEVYDLAEVVLGLGISNPLSTTACLLSKFPSVLSKRSVIEAIATVLLGATLLLIGAILHWEIIPIIIILGFAVMLLLSVLGCLSLPGALIRFFAVYRLWRNSRKEAA